MAIPRSDVEVVRELARRIADIAALPEQAATIALWKANNGLAPVRPMVMIDQIPWHELNVDDELTLICEDKTCRSIEADLRRRLYAWKHMRADMVVEAVVEVPMNILGLNFGITADDDQAITDPENAVVGHAYRDQLATEEDLERIRIPSISHDKRSTERDIATAEEILGGILDVRAQGRVPMFSPWDTISTWRGVESILYDIVDRPEFLHRVVARVAEALTAVLDQLESQGLLGPRQPLVHCTGAWADGLFGPGDDPGRPRASNLWACGQAQILGSVSPDMHEEFDIAYARPWYARFGLGYYGCCEPLHAKLDRVKTIPNVRKISISPWADVERSAEELGDGYVMSRKPSPAMLATDNWDPEAVEGHLRETLRAAERFGTPVEFILKDISTVRYRPERLWEWSDIARRVVGA